MLYFQIVVHFGYFLIVCVVLTFMLLGVFHMLSVLYIWFVLFDLRYLVLRVHHQLCAICLLSPPLLLSLPPQPLLYCHTPARRFPSKTKLGRWVQKKYLLILEQTQP